MNTRNKELSLEQVKEIQMDVLSAIDEFCNANGIKYSLADGSLLGAIRHRGYIPWDDDIDIVLIREDYNRLISEFPHVYKGHYKIASLERNKKWERPYAVAYDKNTVLYESSYEKASIGVKVDIIPVDYLPENISINKYKSKLHRRLTWYVFTNVSWGSNFLKTIIWRLLHITTFFYSRRKMAWNIQKMLCKGLIEKGKMAFEISWLYRSISVYPSSIFEEYKFYPFEERQYVGVVDADKYLTAVYGDYMQLPPIEKRKSHHSFKAFIK